MHFYHEHKPGEGHAFNRAWGRSSGNNCDKTTAVIRKFKLRFTFTKKLLRIMQLTAIILLWACMAVSARGNTQTISISARDASLQNVLKEVQKQSGYHIFYSYELVRQQGKVSVHVKNASLQQALDECFRGTNLTYTIIEKTIVVKQKEEKPASSAEALAKADPPPSIDIRGRVTDADGNPLVGASVNVKGSSLGTTTNNDGVFVLKGVDENATLEISFVGYETYTIAVANKSSIVASLKLKPESLNEVVINKGYYTEKQRLSTGNVSTVKAADIEKQPVNNPLLAMQGRVPGIVITQQNGLPGGGVVVQIRGQNSIERGFLPLYVIDGVPYYSDNPRNLQTDILGNSGTGGGRGGNPLSYINPSDIEAIDVLKDADATAIYGSRGANGVVLITTKKGKAGKMRVDVNFQTGIGQVGNKVKLLNTPQYLEMRREAFKNDGVTNIPSTQFDLTLWDTTRYTDWQEFFIGGTANYHHGQLSLSGGSNNTSYLVSGTYHKETTVFPGDLSNQQGSVNFNLNSSSTDQKFKFNLSGNYNVINNRLVKNDFTGVALTIAPVAPSIYNPDGTINWGPYTSSGLGTFNNPLAAYVNNKFRNLTNNLIVNTIFSYQIIKGLEFKTSLGYNNLVSNDKVIEPASGKDPSRWFQRGNDLRTLKLANNRSTSWIIEPQLLYSRNILKGKFDFLIGGTIQQSKYDGQLIDAEGFTSDLLIEDLNSAAVFKNAGMFNSQYKYNAGFGRISYNWLDKYLINLTGRRDGSSRYGPANRFHNFGAAGIGWVFSKEKFIENHLAFLSYGKIRASYGSTGNENVGDYSFLDLYRSTTVGVPYQGTQGLQITQPFTPDLAWEETKKSELGFELGFLKDRINLTASYYQTESSNQLIPYAVAYTTGFSDITQNLDAVIKNNGWEFTLNTINVNAKDFRWSTSFNIFWNRNKLTQVDSGSVAYLRYKDHSLSSSFVYKMAGVDPTTGIYQFMDAKGNTVNIPVNPTDQIVAFERNPKFSGGFSNTIEYKGFQLDVLFQFVKQVGRDFLYNNIAGRWTRDNITGNQPIGVLDRWQKPGDIKSTQKFSQNFSVSNAYVNAVQSDQGYTDLSFIRLKNVSLSWQIPNRWKSATRLQNCRLYLHGQNLLTFTKYKGLDPENKSVSSLPPLRVITVGLQFGF